jgi:hypothetical protein
MLDTDKLITQAVDTYADEYRRLFSPYGDEGDHQEAHRSALEAVISLVEASSQSPHTERNASADGAFDRLHYMEAWLTGYNACRDGVPNDFDAIMARVKTDHEDSGRQRARRSIELQEFEGRPCSSRPVTHSAAEGQKGEPDA